jgi:hypothetical protein
MQLRQGFGPVSAGNPVLGGFDWRKCLQRNELRNIVRRREHLFDSSVIATARFRPKLLEK